MGSSIYSIFFNKDIHATKVAWMIFRKGEKMGILRDASAKEREDCMDYLPYIFEDHVAEVKVPESIDYEAFHHHMMVNHLTPEIMFKGVNNAEEIVSSGGLDVEKANVSGTYTEGRGIYLADDVLLSTLYGKEILVVETACRWYKRIKGAGMVTKQATPEEILSKGYDGLYAMDYSTTANFSERICFRNEAMLIRYVLTFKNSIFELRNLSFN